MGPNHRNNVMSKKSFLLLDIKQSKVCMIIINNELSTKLVKSVIPGWNEGAHVLKIHYILEKLGLYFWTPRKQCVSVIIRSNQASTKIVKFMMPGFKVQTWGYILIIHYILEKVLYFRASRKQNASYSIMMICLNDFAVLKKL